MRKVAIMSVLLLVILNISGCDSRRNLKEKEVTTKMTYVVDSFKNDQIWDDEVLFMFSEGVYIRSNKGFEDGNETVELAYQEIKNEILDIFEHNDIVNSSSGQYVFREFYYLASSVKESSLGIVELTVTLLKNDSFLIELYNDTQDEPTYGLIFKLNMESLNNYEYGIDYHPDNWQD